MTVIHVHLHCRVNDLHGKTVSWVRRKGDELHLITFGQHIYSSDSRYLLAYQEPNDWQLLIQYVNERDEGMYSCEVNSHPPLVFLVSLSVAVLRCLFTPDKYYKSGSRFELKCMISRNGYRMLNYCTCGILANC